MDTLSNLKEEHEKWKQAVLEEEKKKSEALIRKCDADERRREAERHLESLLAREREIQERMRAQEEAYSKRMEELRKKNNDLKKRDTDLTMRLNEATETFIKLEEELQVENKVEETDINFVGPSKDPPKNESSDISYKFMATVNRPFVLQPGQALLTFENELVAKNIIRKKQFTLNFEGTSVDARALPVHLNKTIKFEIDTNISSKQVRVVNLPADLPAEYIKDKLELKFYKSDVGGGEIEEVEYDSDNHSAVITFLDDGVAQRVVKQKEHQLFPGHEVTVEPCVRHALNKLQLFSDVSQRTVLLTGINGIKDTEENIQDEIEIYFQKPSNGGGEIESIVYTQNKERAVPFEQD
ncbi:N-myc-interactor [Spea bombifrons]|uniref:N-myc-interactor n=1 Tax=Spea bombifrons TaxID=233779 RepID=UPI00234BD0E0|nr:N-myc-interactor [Spea bombifrons]